MSDRRPAEGKRPRLSKSAYTTMRELDVLKAAPESAPALALVADVTALWVRFMVEASPASLGHLYRALFAAWVDNRAECDEDERDRTTVLYHSAFLRRLAELQGRAPALAVTKWDRKHAARLESILLAQLDGMRERVARSSAPQGEGLLSDADVWDELGEAFEEFLEEIEEKEGED